MKKIICLIMTLLLLMIPSHTSYAMELDLDSEVSHQIDVTNTSIPEPFIIDTDFSSDVDDALAISVACGFKTMVLLI